MKKPPFNQAHGADGWKKIVLIGVIIAGVAVMAGSLIHRSALRNDSGWHKQPDLRGLPLTEIRLNDGSTRSLADGQPHVLYLFSTHCAKCDTQRALMAEMLEPLPTDAVVTVSTEPEAAIAGYWSQFVDTLTRNSMRAPLSVEPGWLRTLGLPDEPPVLIFTTRNGRVAEVITGPVLSWAHTNTVRRQLTVAGIREFPTK